MHAVSEGALGCLSTGSPDMGDFSSWPGEGVGPSFGCSAGCGLLLLEHVYRGLHQGPTGLAAEGAPGPAPLWCGHDPSNTLLLTFTFSPSLMVILPSPTLENGVFLNITSTLAKLLS